MQPVSLNRFHQAVLLTAFCMAAAQAAPPEPRSSTDYETMQPVPQLVEPPAKNSTSDAKATATDEPRPSSGNETLPPAPQQAEPPAKDFASDAKTSVKAQEDAGVKVVETSRPLAGVSADTLATARKLYRNLLRAQDAAERQDDIDVHIALNSANDTLDALYTPSAMQALRQQSAIIREDLKREGKPIDDELWLPLQAELDTFRISLPAERYKAATSAVGRGAAAAQNGDKTKAVAALDEIEDSLERRYALLPLGTIRGDLRSAQNALEPDPPYWHGIAEAMASALTSIHWVTTVEANGWISAYTSALSAIEALPADPDAARQWLRTTATHLQDFPQARDVADRASRLSQDNHLTPDALQALIDDIAAHLQTIRASGK